MSKFSQLFLFFVRNKLTISIASALCLVFIFQILIFNSQLIHAQVFPGPERRNVSVSAIVPPAVKDFQFKLDYQGSSLVSQDQTITYEITYGASSSAGLATNNVITVNYSSDKAPDQSYLAEYVFGSASTGYGGIQPVVDTKLRTITWTLPPLPEDTMDQKITFQLRTNGNRHDLKQLTFRSSATFRNEYVTLPTYGAQQDYLFDPSRVTPAPTATPLPPATPTPSPIPVPLFYKDIALKTLTANTAEVAITTSNPTRLIVQYGISPDALTQQAESTALLRYKVLQLTNLKPNTRYYMQITSRDKDNIRLRSDILTFVTPVGTTPLLQGIDAYTFTSGDTILLSNVLNEKQDSTGFFLLTTGTQYTLTYTFTETPSVALMEALVRNENGILQRVTMKKLDDKTYTADLTSHAIGNYTISVSQTDEQGNVSTRTLSSVKMTSPIRVFESLTSSPISDATVHLFQYNAATKQYEEAFSRTIENPAQTSSQGEVRYLLPNGSYRVSVEAFGYRAKTVDFIIGSETQNGYPTIYLDRDLFSVTSLFDLLKSSFSNTYTFTVDLVQSLAGSMRAFTTTAVVSLTSLVTTGFLLFSIRTDIRWKDLLPFFIFHLAVLRRNHKEKFLYGSVVDGDGAPLSMVRVEAMHIKTDEVFAHSDSNKSGGFKFANTFNVPYVKLVAIADGLPTVTMIVPTDYKQAIKVRMDKHSHTRNITALSLFSHIASGLFEIILIMSLVMELLFLEAFGIARTLPFILLTLFNLAVWIFYQKERGIHRV